MASFRCYDNSDVFATVMTNFQLNTTMVAIFPNACLWRYSLYSNLVLTLKTNCIKPSSYASTAYVVVIRPSSLSDSFVKFGQPARFFWANGLPPPPRQNISRRPMIRSVRPGKLGELEIGRTSKSFLRSVTAPIIIDVCCPMGSPYSGGIVRRD